MENASELAHKKEKLAKLKKEKERRDQQQKISKEEKTQGAAKATEKANEDLIKRTERILAEASEKEKEERIKEERAKRLGSSPLRKLITNTISSFVGEYSIPPKIKPLFYDKNVQTIEEIPPVTSPTSDEVVFPLPMNVMPSPSRRSVIMPKYRGESSARKDSLGKKEQLFGVPEDDKEDSERDLTTTGKKAKIKQPLQEVSKDALKNIMASKEFNDFLDRSSKVVEYALANPETDHIDIREEEQHVTKEKISYQFTFPDESQYGTHNKGRAVTALEWMTKHPGFLIVSYSRSEEFVLGEPEGLVKIWTTGIRTRPEYTLRCQSEVTQVIGHPFRPNEVIGGTYAGYVVLWDIRAKQTPVLKSQLTNEAHTFPVYSLDVVGTEKANTIVSVSNNGRMCVWAMEMLTNPHKSIDLKYNTKEVCATCIGFPEEDSNNLYIGAEDNTIYYGQIHSGGEKEADKTNVMDAIQSHTAPVTALSMHPAPASWSKGHDYSHVMLSSSMDWSIKLWQPKHSKMPIASFDSAQDYALDVKWSPMHPGVFASADAEGYLDVWDINADIESPIVHARREPIAINKVGWSVDGKRLAAGNAVGIVSVYTVDKEYHTPRPEEFTKFERLIQSGLQSSSFVEVVE